MILVFDTLNRNNELRKNKIYTKLYWQGGHKKFFLCIFSNAGLEKNRQLYRLKKWGKFKKHYRQLISAAAFWLFEAEEVTTWIFEVEAFSGPGKPEAKAGLTNLSLSCGVISCELSDSGGGGICIQLYCLFSMGMPYFPASMNWPRRLSKQSKQTATISPFSIVITPFRGLWCRKNGKSWKCKCSVLVSESKMTTSWK